jgi:hypothetical protein
MTSPYLIAWDRLPEEVKERNRIVIRDIPTFLAGAGFQVYRMG